MGFRKAIRSYLQCSSAADQKRLDRALSASKALGQRLKVQQTRLDQVESELAVLRRHLQFAEASGSLDNFGWAASSSAVPPTTVARQIKAYLNSRQLSHHTVALGDLSEFADLHDVLGQLGESAPSTHDVPSPAMVPGVVVVGRLDATAFREGLSHLLESGQILDGTLAWLPTPRLGPELTRALVDANEPASWLPWATGLPSGLWVILQRGHREGS